MKMRSSDHIDSSSGNAAQSQKLLLKYATAYFNTKQSATDISQKQVTCSNEISPSETEEADMLDANNRRNFDRLGLTGTIISATASIPYVVALTVDGKFEIGPRSARSFLRDMLSDLSSSSTWHHTLVGWTGKVLPARSAEFGVPLSNDSGLSESVGIGSQLSNVALHDLGGTEISDSIIQHLKNKTPGEQTTSVSKEQRRELETLLEHAFKDKIVPVWIGDWADDKRDVLDLRDQDRWREYAENQLYNGVNSTALECSSSDEQAFANFLRMNESVADAIVKVYKPGDIIWVHDYQLMLLPEILRRQIPSAYVVYFHYTNWADKGTMVKTPNFEKAAAGMLGASLIGFPTAIVRGRAQDYCHSVLKLGTLDDEIIRKDDRNVQLSTVPLGIDLQNIQATAFHNSKADQSFETISDRHRNKKKIVLKAYHHQAGVLLSILDGFEIFLTKYATAAQNTVLFLVTAPGTQRSGTVSAEDVTDANIASRIVSINSRLGGVMHQPIILVHNTMPRHEYFALLRAADLGIATSDDGAARSFSMEFVVCQQDRTSPLLIVETQSHGATNEVSASSVSTENYAIAAYINQALFSSDVDKQEEHKRLLEHFTSNHVSKFNKTFITKICTSLAKFEPFRNVPNLNANALASRFASASRRLLMFDYDGTLTPIVNNPDAALPTEELLAALRRLAAEGRNKVWIISGRSRNFLEKLFGDIPGLGLSAEHGSFIRRPGEIKWNNLAASMDMDWKEEANKAFQELVDEVDGSWIERKEVAIVWHYRNAIDHDTCLAKATECKALLEGEKLKNWDVEVMLGKANIEVRPRFLNKGVTAAGLIDETFAKETSGLVLCAGDDVTDEDMFRALLVSKLDRENIFSCLVSKTGKPSLACYRTPEPADLIDAISAISYS